MSGIKKDYVMPIVVLTAICLVISAALAFTNKVTLPVITEAALVRAETARMEVLPSADSFELMELSGLPETVTEVYKAVNGTGYVFMITTTGYGGDINMICGIDSDANITSCKILSHSETPGLGSKVTDDEFRDQFSGKDSSLDGVSAISGATISSMAYINAIHDAFAAFEIAKEAE